MTITLRPFAGERALLDPTLTGEFAAEMASLAEIEQVPPWCSYAAWKGDQPLGFGGFKGGPDPVGTVEIGYLVFPAARGQGVATAIVRELVAIARIGGAASVIANTLPTDNPSTRVLEKAGFVRDGWGEDEDVGATWQWRAGPCTPADAR